MAGDSAWAPAPARIVTERLVLRRPVRGDVGAVFENYASDVEVTRLLAWPRHRSTADTAAFLEHSDQTWDQHGVGPYLVLDGHERVLGSTGLDRDAPWSAMTGFVLCRDAWGRGLATEIAAAMTELADTLDVVRLHALCHLENRASAGVLAKTGFECEGLLRRHTVFPNLASDRPQDVECWSRVRE